MEIHPLHSYILQNGGKKPEGETWLDLANKFGISPHEPDPQRRAKRAKDRWHKFKSRTKGSLLLKQIKEDGDGNVTSKVFGAPPNVTADKSGLELVGVSEAPSGGAWNIYRKTKPPYAGLTPEQRKEFEEKRDDAERAKISKHLDFKSETSGDFENWLILGCVHVPGHNRHLWDGVLTYLNETKVDGIILAGDFMDFKSLSNHEKGQDRGVTYWDELLAGCEAIGELESVLRENAKKVFLNGNHCDRYYRVLKEIENSRFGEALIPPQKGLKLEERGWQCLNNWKEDYVLLGNNLEIIHGVYVGKNAAKTHLDAAAQVGHSVVFFHTHRMGTAGNGTNTAWNCGFLGDKDSETFRYVPRQVRQGWVNGFCLVTIDSEGRHYVTPVRCSDEHFFVNGKKYGKRIGTLLNLKK